MRDRVEQTTARVSLAMQGGDDSGGVVDSTISADGRYVAFATAAALVAEDTNGAIDVFVHDRSSGQTERVSLDADEAEANGDSSGASLSADGRYVAFWSNAHNLMPEPFGPGIFVRDRWHGTLDAPASIPSAGPSVTSGPSRRSARTAASSPSIRTRPWCLRT